MDKTIASFFSKVFRGPVEVDLSPFQKLEDDSPYLKVASGSLRVRQQAPDNMKHAMSDQEDMIISFMRTVRIPEDSASYDLPPSPGKFLLFDIRPSSERLPVSMANRGGVFLPMYREFLGSLSSPSWKSQEI